MDVSFPQQKRCAPSLDLNANGRPSDFPHMAPKRGPQIVTRRGVETTVPVPIEDWRRWLAKLASQLQGVGLKEPSGFTRAIYFSRRYSATASWSLGWESNLPWSAYTRYSPSCRQQLRSASSILQKLICAPQRRPLGPTVSTRLNKLPNPKPLSLGTRLTKPDIFAFFQLRIRM